MSAQPPDDSGAKSDADPAEVADPTKGAVLGFALDTMINNLAVFAGEMNEAAELFRDTQALDRGRVGCQMALKAVVDFCDRSGLPSECRLPLGRLINALESAENGAVDPLLRVEMQAGAPPLTVAERRQRGYLAAAMEALIRAGSKPNDAAKWVANRSRNMIAAGRVKTDLWKAVKSWRATAKLGSGTEDWDTIAYRAACEALDQCIVPSQQGAEVLLQQAAAEGTF